MNNEIKPLEPSGLIYLLKKIYSKIATSNKNTKDSAKNYTDEKIANLINGAPSTLDTLGEIAQAMDDNKDVVDALEEAIGTRATTDDLTAHTSNTSNPHSVTKTQIGLGNVENKSSATIRDELTKENVTTALGYTPPTSDTTYNNFVKSGSGAKSGLVPAPSTTAGTTKYLREDGTWTTPTNTTYSAASTTANGLMSKEDKAKLDGIASEANKYSLPTASATTLGGVKVGDNIDLISGKISISKANIVSALGYTPPATDTQYTLPTAGKDVLGGVKTTSTVTSATGFTASPIISGVPYYKNTTYSAATTSANGLMSKEDKIKLDALVSTTVYSSGQVAVNDSLVIKDLGKGFFVIKLGTSNPPFSLWLYASYVDYYQYNALTKIISSSDTTPKVTLANPNDSGSPSTGILITGCSHSATTYTIYKLPF